MRAVRFSEYGGPEVLRVEEVDEPHAGPGQVRVRVRAVGVNPVDWKIRSGAMAQGSQPQGAQPVGTDAAGIVDEVGEGVDPEVVGVGDAVFGFAEGGAYAEVAVLGHWASKPLGMAWPEAAGLPVPVETAVRTLDLLGVGAGTTLLVDGASGGVGTSVVQLARARGASVVGTASEANHDLLRELGAVPTTYGAGLPERVRALAPDGVDVALDAAGHGGLGELVEITGSPDRVVTIASMDAQEHGVRFSGGGGDRSYQALGEAARLYEQGRFSLPVERTFALADAAQAHRVSEQGHARGKLVLVVGDAGTGT